MTQASTTTDPQPAGETATPAEEKKDGEEAPAATKKKRKKNKKRKKKKNGDADTGEKMSLTAQAFVPTGAVSATPTQF